MRYKIILSFCVVFLISFFITTVGANKSFAQYTTNLSGRLVDNFGNGFANTTLTETCSDLVPPTTDGNGYFSIPNVDVGKVFCLRAPGFPNYSGPVTNMNSFVGGSYECQTAGGSYPNNCGTSVDVDLTPDDQYNFVYTYIPPAGTITASPNPCTIPDSLTGSTNCTSTITWTTNSNVIYPVVYQLDATHYWTVFSQGVPNGSQNATDVTTSSTTYFLYDEGGGRDTWLAQINVSGVASPYGWHNWTDNSTCTTGGWACDADNYDSPVDVHFYTDWWVWIGAMTANQYSQGLVDYANTHNGWPCNHSGYHAFTYSLPDSFKDGITHNIYAYGINIGSTGSNVLLSNSPISITCPAPAGTIDASPNPCTIPFDSTTCTSQLTWSTNSGVIFPQVYSVVSPYTPANWTALWGGTGNSPKDVTVGTTPVFYELFDEGGGRDTYLDDVSVNGKLSAPTVSHTCNADGTVTLTWNRQAAAESYLIRTDKLDSPTDVWMSLDDWTGLVPDNNTSFCLGAACSFKSKTTSITSPGALSYCTNVGCTSTVTNRSDIYFNTPYTWSVQPVAPGETYPYAGDRGSENFTCSTTSVSGTVFVDTNKNGAFDKLLGESAYTGGGGTLKLCKTSNCGAPSDPIVPTITPTAGSGTYIFSGLTPDDYFVQYLAPAGYQVTTGVSIEANTNPISGPADAIDIDPGITNSYAWFQCQGGDCREDSGFTDTVPSGSFASINTTSSTTPGIVFSGDDISRVDPTRISITKYLVGTSLTYPEIFAGTLRTSYAYYTALAQQNGITPVVLTNAVSGCGAGGIADCTLTGASFAKGIYTTDNDNNPATAQDLYLNAFTVPANKNYIILVNGDLHIKGKIIVDPTFKSTITFSVSGNIFVDKDVKEASNASNATDIDGFYSTDNDFHIEGYGSGACASGTTDKRLNIGGAVVVNAGKTGGNFVNDRDLCGDNANPSVTFQQRLDLIFNAPDFLTHPNFTWQEIAP